MRINSKYLLLSLVLISQNLWSQELKSLEVNASNEVLRLLEQVDTDHDKKITVGDHKNSFVLKDINDKGYSIEGTYHLSNLLQELTLLSEKDAKVSKLSGSRIFENPVERISRSIKERYWDGLTRRIDEKHLSQVLSDSKVTSDLRYLYVPHTDPEALKFYQDIEKSHPGLKMKVVKLPPKITPEYILSLNGKHGLLSLALERTNTGTLRPVPYVVPGGRFNEMYGWDSYFETLGLLADGRVDLAKAMIDNFVYQITHYGKILNANRTYYLTRSQPPFLTSMIRDVYPRLPKSEASREWLKTSLRAAIKEYQEVWMGKDRLTDTGLSRYYGFGLGIPPEVEAGHFNHVIHPLLKKYKLNNQNFISDYNTGKLKLPELDEFLLHDRAVRESGHDTTYRWRVNGEDKCADFVTVDLNSLLYKTELDLAYLIRRELNDDFPQRSDYFVTKAKKRKNLIRKYLWNEKENAFFDFNWKIKKQSTYLAATSLYPLWSVEKTDLDSRILNQVEAKTFVNQTLKKLELPGGVAASSIESLQAFGDPNHERQWDYPNGWAPHQMLIWEGLENYRMTEIRNRLIYRWLYMITRNATDYNGTIPEKYDVLKRSHAVFAEYGNVGTDFSYITTEGFGWMNASFQVGLGKLPKKERNKLKMLLPPEWIN